MKYIVLISLFCGYSNYGFSQLQIKPEGADTMSNAGLARWYAGKYKQFLALSDVQTEMVYELMLDNRNRQDSLRQVKNIRTEDLAANTFALDEQLKTVLTDAQYHDYLRTSQIMEWRPKQ